MTEPEHKSRRYKWDQFADVELLGVLFRLREELGLGALPAHYRPRHRIEEMINTLAEEKGRRVAERGSSPIQPVQARVETKGSSYRV
jgi:hypothetical protein